MSLNGKILKQLNESNSAENYWDATELDRRAFVALLKFNFGSDSKGNNYIVTNDNNELCRFHANTDEEAVEIFRNKKYVDKDFDDLNESEDEGRYYEVAIGFGGFIGIEKDYNVYAKSRVDAVNYVLDEPGSEAEMDLEATNVEDLGDGEYEVTVIFDGCDGGENQYTVSADDEEDAKQQAIEEAKSDLEVISVDGTEFSYDEAFESNINESSDEDILDKDIEVYDINEFIQKDHPEYESHNFGLGAAILIKKDGSGCIVDYEGVGSTFKSVSDEVHIDLHERSKDEEGKKTIHIIPSAELTCTVSEILDETPHKSMKVKDFFNKYNYNDRCARNFEGIIPYIEG